MDYKYEGEQALRTSGVPYTIVRPERTAALVGGEHKHIFFAFFCVCAFFLHFFVFSFFHLRFFCAIFACFVFIFFYLCFFCVAFLSGSLCGLTEWPTVPQYLYPPLQGSVL